VLLDSISTTLDGLRQFKSGSSLLLVATGCKQTQLSKNGNKKEQQDTGLYHFSLRPLRFQFIESNQEGGNKQLSLW